MADIYFDNAAATPIAPQVQRAMARAQKHFANPSSFNDAGRASAVLLDEARSGVATFLNARADEVVFCSSGSEANTLAICGSVRARGSGSIITAPTEHLSVLEVVASLHNDGHAVEFLKVDGEGRVGIEELLKKLIPSVTVVSLMYANNEIGTIAPIARIGRAIAQWRKEHRSAYPLFHVDACQATTTLDMDVQRLGVDLLTFNGAKAYGPHGCAVLFVRRGIALEPVVHGGSQERGRRAGTEDIASACGLAVAVQLITPTDAPRLASLRDRFISGIISKIPDAHINGPVGDSRLAGNINFSIPGCDSENLLLELDRHDIRAGSGSACTAHRVEPSHVLVAIGTPKQYLEGALRFSLGRQSTKKEVDRVLKILPQCIARVRARRARAS